jgi:hypothetical protein
LGGTCIPNPDGAFVTWFGWLIAFACLSAVIQFTTTGFCLAVYMRSFFRHDSANFSTTTGGSAGSTKPVTPVRSNLNIDPTLTSDTKGPPKHLAKRLAWRRVKKVLLLQWRSIVLSLFVIVETIYFGVIYVMQVRTSHQAAQPEHTEQIYKWTECLVLSQGDQAACLHLAKGLSLPEATAVASFFMVSVRLPMSALC